MNAIASNEKRVSIELEVPFHDVDLLGIVWHGHFFKYFEIARTALFRARGIDNEVMRDTGYRFVVMESRIRHGAPLRCADRARVTAWLGSTDMRVDIHYLVHNLTTDKRAARGFTALVTTDAEGGLVYKTPEVLRALLEA